MGPPSSSSRRRGQPVAEEARAVGDAQDLGTAHLGIQEASSASASSMTTSRRPASTCSPALDVHLGHGAVRRGPHLVLHLHGLDGDQGVAGGDRRRPTATATLTTVPGNGATRAPAASWLPGSGKRSTSVEGRRPVGSVDEVDGPDLSTRRSAGRTTVRRASDHGVDAWHATAPRCRGASAPSTATCVQRPVAVEAVVDVDRSRRAR